MKEIRNIIFDFGNVLYDVRYENVADWLARLGAAPLASLYTKNFQTEEINAFECGLMSPSDFRAYLRMVAKQMLGTDIQVSDRQIDNIINSMLLGLPRRRVELLIKARRHYRLFLFSNTNQIHYDYFVRQTQREYGCNVFDEYLEKSYFSHIIHTRKPSRQGFDLIVSENGLDRAETLFIDDLERNAKAAAAAGLQHHHLTETDLVELFDNQGRLVV